MLVRGDLSKSKGSGRSELVCRQAPAGAEREQWTDVLLSLEEVGLGRGKEDGHAMRGMCVCVRVG